jgi:hypothetical protein
VSGFGRRLGIGALVASGLLSLSSASSQDGYRPQDFRTTSVFQLAVESSSVLRPGQSKIVAQSALATRAKAPVAGHAAGLEILFLSQPLTETSRAEALARQARDLQKRDHAVLQLFLDTQGKISQVNLGYVVPGTTVSRTIAWKPEDLQKFSRYALDGKRLTIKSKGVYSESADERLTLSWDIDVSLPVLDPIKP